MTSPVQRWVHWLGRIAWILPIALFVGLLATSAENVPQWDDFPSILAFAGDWQGAVGAGAKWALLHEQYFSHRIVLTKLATLAVLLPTGHVNFLVLQVLGWVGWVAVFALVARQLPAGARAGWPALPLALVLMQPQGYSNHLIAMQAIQNIGVILWACGTLALLPSPHPAARAVALGLLASAPLVSANGLMLLPAAILVAAFGGPVRRFAPVLAAGGLGWALFLVGYVSSAKPLVPVEFIANALAMAGSPAAVFTLGTREAVAAGAVLLIGAAWALLRPTNWRTAPVITGWICFLVLSVLMAARGRIGWGVAYMLQDRYRVYGVLLAALLYVRAWPWLQRRWPRLALPASATVAALFCFASYVSSWPLAAADLAWARASAANRQLGTWAPATGDDYWNYAIAQLERAERLGFYHLPTPWTDGFAAELRALPPSAPTAALPERVNPDVFGRSLLPAATSPRPLFGLLTGAKPVVLPVHPFRASARQAVLHGSVFGDGYSLPLPDRLATSEPATLIAVGRDDAGRPVALWSATVSGKTVPATVR